MTSNNLTPEQKIDEILELIKLETCDKTYAQSNGTQSWQMPEQFISIAGKEEAKQQLLTLLEEEKIKGMLKMVETANCILQADEPAIDEIWFDLDMPDDSIMPMRQDTMLSELKHRLQALKQESKK